MDFELNEEQKMIQSTIRNFAQAELASVAEELDEAEELSQSVLS